MPQVAEHEAASFLAWAVMRRKGIPCQEGQVLSPILNPRYLSSSLTPLRRNALWLLNQSQRVDASSPNSTRARCPGAFDLD